MNKASNSLHFFKEIYEAFKALKVEDKQTLLNILEGWFSKQ